jgi:hypothetical protein
VKELASLSAEVGGPPIKNRKRVKKGAFEPLVRKLDPLCRTPELAGRLRAAVAGWVDNGGVLEAEVQAAPAEEAERPQVTQHKLLAPAYRLNSDAFMTTYNARKWTRQTWDAFLAFMMSTAAALHAAVWGACQEVTTTATAPAGTEVVHFHGYLMWKDGRGLRARNTDVLVFDDVRPRVDVCYGKARLGPYREAAPLNPPQSSSPQATAPPLTGPAVVPSGSIFSRAVQPII